MSEHIQFPYTFYIGNYKQKEREHGAGGEADAAQAALHACAGELLALWRDPVLSEILRWKRIRVDDGPGFFLDDLEHITTPQYLPSNGACSSACDALHADGPCRRRAERAAEDLEYQFEMEAGSESGMQWRIIDIGSSRSQVSSVRGPDRRAPHSLAVRGGPRSAMSVPPPPSLPAPHLTHYSPGAVFPQRGDLGPVL
ncbi:hypothetical protein BKA93DRAFT_830408 [Sparassis latifolia]